MIVLDEICCTYNEVIQPLCGVSITLNEGEIIGLLGPNGAGKTTTLRCITGEIRILKGRITHGRIEYKGRSLQGVLPHQVTRKGISLVPEDRKLFMDMTVEENLFMGGYLLDDPRELNANFEKVFEYFPLLRDLRPRAAGFLSGGEQQMLAIGRALMCEPAVLLLDEPSIGLAPQIIANIFNILKQIREEERTSILLVEQNANMTLKITDRCYIVESGRTVLSGESDELRNNSRIRDIYLGIS